jgi:hypothetical protein
VTASSKSCRNCGAPLAEAAAGECRGCGTLFGPRPEIREYAEAVLEGNATVARPELLDIAAMRVTIEGDAGGESYRDAAAPSRRLRFELHYGNWKNIAMVPFALAAGGLLIWGWMRLVASELSWWWMVPLALMVGYYVYARVTTVFDRFSLVADRERVRWETSRYWPREVHDIPVSKIAQLCVLHQGNHYTLQLRPKEGQPLGVMTVALGAIPLYLEALLENVLALADAPVPDEMRHDAPVPKLPKGGTRRRFLETVIVSSMVAVPFVVVASCGRTGREFMLTEQVGEVTVTTEQPAQLKFNTGVEFTSSVWRSLSDVPRTLRYEIEVLSGEKSVAKLNCDPFDTFLWFSNTSNKRLSSFTGSMNGCETSLPAAGSYRIRARRVAQPGAEQLPLKSTELIPRVK